MGVAQRQPVAHIEGFGPAKPAMSIKHISIIVIIALLSLGSITALAFRLLRHDLQISAEENNAKINRMAAMETESVLANVRSNSLVLIQTITAAGTQSTAAQAVDFFFEENPLIATIFFSSGSQTDRILVNKSFFLSKEIDEALADSYLNDSVTALRRAAAGETLLLNAAPHFIVPVLALFFPWQNGGMGVLFSQGNLNNAFFLGANQSYLLNDSGDILIHADFGLVSEGVNVADNDFTRYVWDMEARNSYALYTGEGGMRYFRAFTKLNIAGCMVITDIEYDKVFEEIDAATRRIIYLSAGVLLISIMLLWLFAKGGSKTPGRSVITRNSVTKVTFDKPRSSRGVNKG
jgi:adenylate cyclase